MSEPQLLRFATAGSVDDGKSTLIGRLLHDTGAVLDDQLASVQRTSRARGDDYVDLALLVDGLRAEREQGITIDVAYRYFATAKRRFIIADTPGHLQYTRNMVTGASTAELALILADARKGILEQTRRHAFLASLLRVPHLVLCVNKMDLVDFDERTFEALRAEFQTFCSSLEVADVTAIPVSALGGDNVVTRSARTPWYHGPPLLERLETVDVASDRNLTQVRFPVQLVIRPQSKRHGDYRAYAGQLLGGVLHPGDELLALPSGRRTRILSVQLAGREIAEAFPPMSISVTLADDLDIGRGDMLCGPTDPPAVGQDLEATLCWMSERPLEPGARLVLKHTTRSARALVQQIQHRLDVNTLQTDPACRSLQLNDIGRVTLRTTAPLFFDAYQQNRHTGCFILMDEGSNATVAGGMIGGVARPGRP